MRNNFSEDLFVNIPMCSTLSEVPWFNMLVEPSGASIEVFFRIIEYIHFIFDTEAIGHETMCPLQIFMIRKNTDIWRA